MAKRKVVQSPTSVLCFATAIGGALFGFGMSGWRGACICAGIFLLGLGGRPDNPEQPQVTRGRTWQFV